MCKFLVIYFFCLVDPKHFNEYIIFVICYQLKSRHVESIQDFFNNKIMRPIIESVPIFKVFEIINPSLHPWYHLWEVKDLNFVCLNFLMHQRIFTYHYGIFLKKCFAIFLKCIFFVNVSLYVLECLICFRVLCA